MKRFTAVRYLVKAIKDNDAAIFIGDELCKEVFPYDRKGFLYIKNSFGYSVPLATGLAMATDKRVFLFIGEGEILRDMSALAQAAVSRCRNLVLVLLDNGEYQSAGSLPNIFNQLYSAIGTTHNFGLSSYNFTRQINDDKLEGIQGNFDGLRGPAVIFIQVEPGTKRTLEDFDLDQVKNCFEFSEFVRDRDLGTSVFPETPMEKAKSRTVRKLDLDGLYGGK